MEPNELEHISKYAQRLNHAEGDLSELSAEERKHLATLLRKYQLEQQLAQMENELAQLKMEI